MRKKFSIKSEYESVLNYLIDSRKFIYAIILIFGVSFFTGFFVPPPEALRQEILDFIVRILSETEGMSHGGIIKYIFLNNLQSSFTGMVFGVGMGIFSVFASVSNGYLVGFVSSVAVSEEGIFVLWRLLPHGIFELPAIFISLGLGLKLGTFVFHKDKFKKFNEFFINSIKAFVYIVLPLLIVAGVVEGTLIYFGS